MKHYIEDLESEIERTEKATCEMNQKVSEIQLQLEKEQHFYQNQLDQKNAHLLKLTTELSNTSKSNSQLAL